MGVLPPRLIALTPGDLARESDCERVVRVFTDCARHGLLGVVVREPQLGDLVLYEFTTKLRTLFASGWLGLHDRVHLAVATRADAVHLGWRSLRAVEARAILPDAIAIGVSSHESDDPAMHSGCDHLFFGPVRDTPSKQGLKSSTGFDGLARAVAATSKPVWALGGLRPEDVPAVLASGAAGIVVLGGIVRARDPGGECRRYLEAIGSGAAR